VLPPTLSYKPIDSAIIIEAFLLQLNTIGVSIGNVGGLILDACGSNRVALDVLEMDGELLARYNFACEASLEKLRASQFVGRAL